MRKVEVFNSSFAAPPCRLWSPSPQSGSASDVSTERTAGLQASQGKVRFRPRSCRSANGRFPPKPEVQTDPLPVDRRATATFSRF